MVTTDQVMFRGKHSQRDQDDPLHWQMRQENVDFLRRLRPVVYAAASVPYSARAVFGANMLRIWKLVFHAIEVLASIEGKCIPYQAKSGQPVR